MTRLLMVLGLALVAVSGGLTAYAFSAANQPTPQKTVTINVATGPQGATGPPGPAGSLECPTGYVFGDLVINHPGGQTTIFTCIKS